MFGTAELLSTSDALEMFTRPIYSWDQQPLVHQ